MQIILLSGGSGTRLWPLSNDARSKQFLKLLPGRDGMLESMIQRVVRQIGESEINAGLTVATSLSQKDSVIAQIGGGVDIVTEPCRRDTFPAICLACEYLSKAKHCKSEETVIVMPCDPYTEAGYFSAISQMARAVESGFAEMMVMGITPTYPSAKYGYIVPRDKENNNTSFYSVERFTEKPDVATAEKLIAAGAQWNGGVFAFRLGYLTSIVDKYVSFSSFDEYVEHYCDLPKISFDYEVAEKAESIGMVKFNGKWKDLGTWNTLTDELGMSAYGNVLTDNTYHNTHLINELNIPMLCLGTKNLIVAASPDGIIISEKDKSENVKNFAASLKCRPMYEERRWGTYKVIDSETFADGYSALTKQLVINPGSSISYQRHNKRDEIWTFIDGSGEMVLDGKRFTVGRGDVVTIPQGAMHAVKASTALTFIEVQRGSELSENDIERFDFEW